MTDCIFGGVDYLGRLLLVTLVPLLIVLLFSIPLLLTFFFNRHRRSAVFDQFSNSTMWVIYLIYPLLCMTTLQVIVQSESEREREAEGERESERKKSEYAFPRPRKIHT